MVTRFLSRSMAAAIIHFGKLVVNSITIPNHEPIKATYVRMVKEIVEAEQKNKED